MNCINALVCNIFVLDESSVYMDYLQLIPKQKLPKGFTLDDSQVHQMGSGFVCGECGRTYKLKSSLRNHKKWECGKEPQFKCSLCDYKAKQKMHLLRHMQRLHQRRLTDIDVKPFLPDEQRNQHNIIGKVVNNGLKIPRFGGGSLTKKSL